MEENKEFTIKQIKDMKMTDMEKESTWDGILRRVTDYPEGEYPFERKPSTWDGIKRRKSDYPDGNIPQEILDLIAREREERKKQGESQDQK
jgi:hypothetical protein